MTDTRWLLVIVLVALAAANRSATAELKWGPCPWEQHFPQGIITVRGGLQVARYQPTKNGPWKRAYLLTFSKDSRCLAQVNPPKDLHMTDEGGALVEVTGTAKHGGDVAAYTIVARRVRFLKRHID